MEDQEKLERIKAQFEQVDRFLKDNSKKFYSEYGAHNAELVTIRRRIETHTDEIRELAEDGATPSSDLESVAVIDAEGGVANELNKKTVALARITNPPLFKALLRELLPSDKLAPASMQKIPLEVDAIVFMTNPLLVFILLNNFIVYREKQPPFVYMYITNRMAKWLFRFTQFVMSYDQLEKIVRGTFLSPERFDPCKRHFLSTVEVLCEKASETLLDREKPVFLNDIRRLYIILTRVVILSSAAGQSPPSEVAQALAKINPVLDLNPEELRSDGIYKEFQEHRFTNPANAKYFSEKLNLIRKQDPVCMLDLLGHIHSEDRFLALSVLYRQAKAYVIQLFLDIRAFYEANNRELPLHVQELFIALRKTIRYEDVKSDSGVPEALIEEAFWNGVLFLDKVVTRAQTDLGSIELQAVQEMAQKTKLKPERIFRGLGAEAQKASAGIYLWQMAQLPYCFLTIESGKPTVGLFTFGEAAMLGLDDKSFEGVIRYLRESGQISKSEVKTIRKEFPTLKKKTEKMSFIGSKSEQLNLFDVKGHLRFGELTPALHRIRNKLRLHQPDFLGTLENREFLFDILREVERWVAREQGVSVRELDPEWVPPFLRGEKVSEFFDSLETSLLGRRYKKQLGSERALLVKLLVGNQSFKRTLMEYEQSRFQMEDGDNLPKGETELTESILAPFLAKTKIFEVLAKKPKPDRQQLLELARIPFRFLDVELGRPRMVLFTLADMIAGNVLKNKERGLLDFLYRSGQLTDSQLESVNLYTPAMLMLLRQLFAKLYPGNAQYDWRVGRHGEVDFSRVAKILPASDRAIRKKFGVLVGLKDHMQMLLEGVEEGKRLISQQEGRDFESLSRDRILELMRHPDTVLQLLDYVKATPFGRRHMDDWSFSPRDVEAIRQRLIADYQITVQLNALGEVESPSE